MIKYVTIFMILIILSHGLSANELIFKNPDSLKVNAAIKRSELFYDSLEMRAHRHRVTGWVHDALISTPREEVNSELISYEYYKQFEGKTVASVTIHPLDVFGPTFDDTTRVAKSWLERFANSIHTKSNLNVIRKNLWVKEGVKFDPNLMMDNERLLRSLPSIQDVKVIVTTQTANNQLVDILILTKDLFAFGVTGKLDNITSGSLGMYNQNVFGIGHQIQTNLVVNGDAPQEVGFETYYMIDNFAGNFINFRSGYLNTFQREGFLVSFDREFLHPQTTWAGGFNFNRFFRTDRFDAEDHMEVKSGLNLSYIDLWYGRNLQLGIHKEDKRFQMTISGRVRYQQFFDRTDEDINQQLIANSTFYLGSISISRRIYIRDRLIYSYGITEDIPKGYLHELVVGYDHNEFIKRWYSHWYFSSSNLVKDKPYYLFASTGAGGFFNKNLFEQGQVQARFEYISRLFNAGRAKARQFLKLNYLVGINRYENDSLVLHNGAGIRGFSSSEAKGTQRLSLNMETVLFQNREFLKFKMAVFSFLDIGIIGSNQKLIFTQNYYAGMGFGIRLRNESLVFKTLQVRFAIYPKHPSDVKNVGFIFEEQGKTRFYSFQPRSPEPLRFE